MALNTHTTVIYHPVRKSLNITALEYCFIDTVLKLADNRDSKFYGWCYASKQELANDFGITRAGLHKMIVRLEKMGLIEISPKGHIRHSQKWYDSAVLNKDSIVLQSDVNKVDDDKSVNLVYRQRKLSLQSDVNKVDDDSKQSLQSKEQGSNREFEQGNNKEDLPVFSKNENPFIGLPGYDEPKAKKEKKDAPAPGAARPKTGKTGRKDHTFTETFELLKVKNANAHAFFLNSPDIWDSVMRYRIEIKSIFASAESEAIAMVKFWKDCEGNRENAEAMIEKTVSSGYKGFFPIDKRANNNTRQQTPHPSGTNPYTY